MSGGTGIAAGARMSMAPRRMLEETPCGPAAAVAAVLARPEEALDYAQAKLAFDALVDPSLDRAAAMAELDRLTEAARRLAGHGADDGAKLGALRRLLHESGLWNDGRPFAYDHEDPLGQHIPNKLLHNYLRTRRGQCVSMPVLFLILADRLGLRVGLCKAPDHMFVRWTAPDGRGINIEATSGGYPARDAWFRQTLSISDRAIESGLYMRTLGRRESVALMATTVAEHLRNQARHEELIAVCGVILEHDSRCGFALVAQGSAYGALLQREFDRNIRCRSSFPSI